MGLDPGAILAALALAAFGVGIALRRRARMRARKAGRLGPKGRWTGREDDRSDVVHGGSGDASDGDAD